MACTPGVRNKAVVAVPSERGTYAMSSAHLPQLIMTSASGGYLRRTQ